MVTPCLISFQRSVFNVVFLTWLKAATQRECVTTSRGDTVIDTVEMAPTREELRRRDVQLPEGMASHGVRGGLIQGPLEPRRPPVIYRIEGFKEGPKFGPWRRNSVTQPM